MSDVRIISTSSGDVEYVGPGWYYKGKRVGCDKVSPIPGAGWLDLEYHEEITRMVSEGCPHTDGATRGPVLPSSATKAGGQLTLSEKLRCKANAVFAWAKSFFQQS